MATDGIGNALSDGDTMVVTRDLKVRGMSQKRGSQIKGPRLTVTDARIGKATTS